MKMKNNINDIKWINNTSVNKLNEILINFYITTIDLCN